MPRKFFVLLALMAQPACGGFPWPIPGPTPTPTPTPTPIPTPSPVCQPPDLVTSCWHQPPGQPWLYICPGGAPQVGDPKECPTVVPGTPLRTDGNRFVPSVTYGTVSTHHGWPFMERSAVDAMVAAGLVKPGGVAGTAERAPGISDDRVGFEIYERVAGTATKWAPPLSTSGVLGLLSASSPEEAEARAKLDGIFNQSPALRSVLARGVKIPAAVPKYDLTKFAKPYQEKLRAESLYKHEHGIVNQRGLWDCWIAIHRAEFPIWWTADYNINGVDLMRVDDFRQAPHPVIKAHVREEVRITGAIPTTIYEVGNEAYRCKPTKEFVDGIRDTVRAAEREFGYVEHIFSPGSLGPNMDTEQGTSPQYLSAHGLPRPAVAVPILINEFAPQKQGEFLARFGEAQRLGVTLWYWHDDNPYEGGAWDDPAWEREWVDTMVKMTGTPPVTGCSTVPNEDAIKVEPRPASKYHEQVNKVHLALNPLCASALAAHQARLKRQAVSGVVEAEGVGERCDIPMQANAYRLAFAQRAREMFPDLCTGIQTDNEGLVDEVSMGSPQEAQNYHVFACKKADCPPEHPDCGCDSGTVAWAPGSVRDTWRSPTTASCLPAPPLGKFELKNAGMNRVVVDATPKTCSDQEWNRRCSTGNTCSPGGAEGNPDRLTVEAQWGPYAWTVDGAACPTCFFDGGNPLRLVAPGQDGKTIRVTGGNGVFAEIVGAHP